MMLDEAREESGGHGGAGSKANVFSFTAAISACGKTGHWQEAVRLLDVREESSDDKGAAKTTYGQPEQHIIGAFGNACA